MLKDRLLEAGMAEADAASRAALVHAAAQGFRQGVHAPPAWLWFVPGRIEIFGKHTDYAGGRSLLCTVPRGIAVAARPRADRTVRITDLHDGETATIGLDDDRRPRPGLYNYATVVARRLAWNFSGAQLGTDIAILSDLPRAAGVSSSSALVVGIASAMIARGSLATHPTWIANITSIDDKAWYLGCVENGLDYRGLPSSSGVGTLGGSEDHTAILACKAGQVSQYRFVPVEHINDVPIPSHWTFVIASSGVQADKAGSVREAYNRASRGTQVLLDIWNQQADAPAGSLGGVLKRHPDAVKILHDLAGRASSHGFPSSALQIRLGQFAREDARIPAAADAFAAADADALGAIAADSQQDADVCLGNQVPETRALVTSALQLGGFAASAFGAGFGGSVWALVASDGAERFAEHWLAQYHQSFPHRALAESFVSAPGPPLIELPVVTDPEFIC